MTDAEISDTGPPERGSLKRGMGFAASSFVANVIVQLASSVLTSRLYGVDVIGEYALVTAPWLTLIQFSTVSEQVAMVRDLSVLPARDRRVGRLFFPVLTFSSALTATAAVVIMLLSVLALRGPVDQADLVLPSLVVLLGYVVIENVSWNMDSVFSAFRAGQEIFLARLTQAIAFLVFSVGFYALSGSVWGLALATVASFFCAFVVRLTMIGRYLAKVSLSEVRDGFSELPRILRFALRLVPGSIANGLSSQAATWLLGALTTVTEVGAYSRASGIAIRIQDAGHRLSEMVYPALVERRHNDDRAGMNDDLALAMRGATLPLFLIAAVGGGVSAGALRIFGDGFDQAADAFALLLVAYCIGVTSLTLGNAFLALDRPIIATWLVVLRSVVMIGLTWPLTAEYGATGAASAFLAGYVVDLALRCWILRRTELQDSVDRMLRTLLSVAIASVPSYVVARVIDRSLEWPIGLVVGGVAGSVVYGVVLLLTGGVHRDELLRLRDRVNDVASRRRRAVSDR